MHRFFADEPGIRDGLACLTASDAHHALHVLRLSVRDEIELVWGEERFLAEICEVSGESVTVRVRHPLQETEAKTRVTLFQGLPKADKMEWIVQKATELGACAIRPVTMERSIVRLDGKDAEKKTQRWQKIAHEALKQCARTADPEVRLPRKLRELEGELRELDVLLVPWEEATHGSIMDALSDFPEKRGLSIGILIGPEGGISPQEAEMLKGFGGRLVTLGPRILRTETAGLCALSVVMALCGELE